MLRSLVGSEMCIRDRSDPRPRRRRRIVCWTRVQMTKAKRSVLFLDFLLFYTDAAFFHTCERRAFSVVLPTFGAMRCFTPFANNHVLHDFVAANWTTKIIHNCGLIFASELKTVRLVQHQLIEQLQTTLNKIQQRLPSIKPLLTGRLQLSFLKCCLLYTSPSPRDS